MSGLTETGLVLQNNGADDLAIASSGSFTFAGKIADNKAYDVSVKTQPTGSTQLCSASSSTGTVSGADVTNVAVTCCANGFASCDGDASNGCEIDLAAVQETRIVSQLTTTLCIPPSMSTPVTGTTWTICTGTCSAGVNGCLLDVTWQPVQVDAGTGAVVLAATVAGPIPIRLVAGPTTITCTLSYSTDVTMNDTALVTYGPGSETLALTTQSAVVTNTQLTGCGGFGAVIDPVVIFVGPLFNSYISDLATAVTQSAISGTASCQTL